MFVEKPLALTAEDCAAVAKAVADAGVLLTVGFNRRYSPHVQLAKRLLADRTGPKMMVYRANAGFIPLNELGLRPGRGRRTHRGRGLPLHRPAHLHRRFGDRVGLRGAAHAGRRGVQLRQQPRDDDRVRRRLSGPDHVRMQRHERLPEGARRDHLRQDGDRHRRLPLDRGRRLRRHAGAQTPRRSTRATSSACRSSSTPLPARASLGWASSTACAGPSSPSRRSHPLTTGSPRSSTWGSTSSPPECNGPQACYLFSVARGGRSSSVSRSLSLLHLSRADASPSSSSGVRQ